MNDTPPPNLDAAPPREGPLQPGARPVAPALALLLPLLFVLYPVLSVYTVNRGEIGVGQAGRPLLVGAAGALAFTGLLWAFARGRDGRRAAVAVCVVLLALCTQDVAAELILAPLVRVLGVAPLPLVWCLLWVGLAAWLLRTRRDVANTWAAAWIVGGVLLLPTLPPVAQAVWTGLRSGQWGTRQDARAEADARQRTTEERQAPSRKTAALTGASRSNAPPSTAPDAPDLFVLVLDAYGRQDVLRTLYGLDNEPFLNALTAQGFSVARESRANYIQTVLALEAALNLKYLARSETHLLDRAVPNIQANAAAKTLRAHGYRILYVATGFPLSEAGYPDEVREPNPPLAAVFTPLERTLLLKTPFAPLMVNERVAFDRHRLKLEAALDAFAETATIPGPKFVLAHVLAPHPPFVFGPHGESVYPKAGIFNIGDATDFTRGSSPEEYRNGYAGQVRHLNTMVLKSLAALRSNATRPAVIVVLGDHGPRLQTDWRRLDRTNVRESFYNLLAVSAPPAYQATVTAATTGDTTPVSVFRRLFTDIYASPHPPIPDRSYYSTLRAPYRFTDVTAQVKGHVAEARP